MSHDRSCDQKEEEVKDQEVPKSEMIKCTEKSPVCLDYSSLTVLPDIGRFYKNKFISGKMFINFFKQSFFFSTVVKGVVVKTEEEKNVGRNRRAKSRCRRQRGLPFSLWTRRCGWLPRRRRHFYYEP